MYLAKNVVRIKGRRIKHKSPDPRSPSRRSRVPFVLPRFQEAGLLLQEAVVETRGGRSREPDEGQDEHLLVLLDLLVLVYC